jgi:hypothetical protein
MPTFSHLRLKFEKVLLEPKKNLSENINMGIKKMHPDFKFLDADSNKCP